MDNLLSSTEVGTIFLDKELRIRKFTPQIAETFTLVPHDLGRSIETFTNRLDHPELVEDLKRVLASGQSVERELHGVAGKSFFLRILPYRAKGAIDGAVITVIDVSINELLSFSDEFSAALDQVRNNPAGTIQFLESKLKEAFNLQADSTLIKLA